MNVIVIGGGAAGMLASAVAASEGNHVILIEKNNKLGKKLFLTGKGRCNLTNACDVEELFNNVVNNKKFLYSSIYSFDNKSVIEYFERLGLRLKIERGNRVFPVSDHSSDVIKTLEKELIRLGVDIRLNKEVKCLNTDLLALNSKDYDDIDVEIANRTAIAGGKQNDKRAKKAKKKKEFKYIITGVTLSDGTIVNAEKIIMATGGESYPSTGSDGTAYKMLEEYDIEIKPRVPALVPLCVKEQYVYDMSGLPLKNVSLSTYVGSKKIYDGFGEMLFTHFGVSGPLILSSSSYLAKYNDTDNITLHIDLKPALSMQELDDRVLRDFSQMQNKQLKNSLNQLLPSSIIPSVIYKSEIDSNKTVNNITKEERLKLCSVIKDYVLTVSGNRGFNEAIITSGGVSVSDINPSTMESKIVKGLYFAGEMIDVDALTGGFNLQIAWSTAYLAAKQEEL